MPGGALDGVADRRQPPSDQVRRFSRSVSIAVAVRSIARALPASDVFTWPRPTSSQASAMSAAAFATDCTAEGRSLDGVRVVLSAPVGSVLVSEVVVFSLMGCFSFLVESLHAFQSIGRHSSQTKTRAPALLALASSRRPRLAV